MKEIRKLKANEIETRPQQIIQRSKGAIMLLYKDARADMKILDETFGPMNWQREHKLINGSLFCQVSVWDDEKEQWVTKEDVGTESRTEKEKGQASDSFKRACTNVGIGRELYTSPFIWINLNDNEIDNKGRLKSKVKFSVKQIEYNKDDEISQLVIEDQDGNERFKMNGYIQQPKNNNSSGGNKKDEKATKKQIASIREWVENEKGKQIIINYLKNNGYHSGKDIARLSKEQAKELLEKLNKEVS